MNKNMSFSLFLSFILLCLSACLSVGLPISLSHTHMHTLFTLSLLFFKTKINNKRKGMSYEHKKLNKHLPYVCLAIL